MGVRGPERYFRVCSLTRGGRVIWIVRLVQIGADGEAPFVDVMTINRPDDLDDIANLGLTVADGKRLSASEKCRPRVLLEQIDAPDVAAQRVERFVAAVRAGIEADPPGIP